MIGKLFMDFNGTMSEWQIEHAIQVKKAWNVELMREHSYFIGKNPPILATSLGNKVPVPFGRKLVKTVIGFMFKEGSISYRYPDDSGTLGTKMDDIFRFNDEPTENVRLGRDQARYGAAYEFLFVSDKEARPQFYRAPASQVIPVYASRIKPDMRAAICFYNTFPDGAVVSHVDVYYPDRIERFVRGGNGTLVSTGVTMHYFGDVPMVEYRNNEEGEGDIESVEKLIDIYDKLVSSTVENDDKFNDALMVLKNVGVDDDTIKKIQQYRLLEIPDGAEVSYLTKPDVYDGKEKIINLVEKLIYSMSGVPKLDDRDAMSQESGEALKYLFASFEDMVAGDKQSGFNDGLQRRLRMLCTYEDWLEGKGQFSPANGNDGYDPDGVTIQWTRNLPNETTTIVDNAVKAVNYLSKKTFVEQMRDAGIVSDVDEEIQRQKDEKAETETSVATDAYAL